MRSVIALWRFFRVLLHTLYGWYVIRFGFTKKPHAQREQIVQRWALGLLQVLHVDLQAKDVPTSREPALLAVNHISWLDIVVLLASMPCRFISKSEVQQWPLLGRMAQANETIFLQRQRRSGVQYIQKSIGEQLHRGAWVVLFAEGTTSTGETVLPFHSNLFQVPILAKVPVFPVVLGYFDALGGNRSSVASYVGDDSMLLSLWRVLCTPRLLVQVRFGEALSSEGHTRKTLATQAHAQVQALQQTL